MPSVVLLLAVVGLATVLQHTPLMVIVVPPSLKIVPPLTAPTEVICVTVVVFTEDATASVVKLTSLP